MKLRLLSWMCCCLGCALLDASAQSNTTVHAPAGGTPRTALSTTNHLGLVTNGPARVQLFQITQSWTNPTPLRNPILATNPYYMKMRQSTFSWTNAVFDGFVPGSLHYVIWTNFLTLTNGRSLHLWSERTHPAGWPATRPVVRWNTNNVAWGLRGLTALSPCWEGEGYPGQVPFTALTRRHAYTRGHGVGVEGFGSSRAGQKVWFLTRDNTLVEAVIARHVTRTSPTNGVHRDYTLVLFDRDLPDSIEPVRVVGSTNLQAHYRPTGLANAPYPIFQSEQSGSMSTGVAPLVVNTWKSGDSGSPNLIPLPGELVFISGRSTSGPSREMQNDMDELCRLQKLNPQQYQLRHADLSQYPRY